ncbi:MAG: hypothetical protein WA979_03545 [Pacificimonas sp.]
MTMLATLIAAGTAMTASQSPNVTLVDFLDAMEGRCWAVDAKGIAIPREDLPALTGTVEIECLTATLQMEQRI